MRVAYQKPVQCRKGVRFHVVLFLRSCTPPFRSVTCFVGWLGNTLSHAYIRHVLIAFCLGYVARPAGIFRDNILRSIVGYNNLCAPWRAATVRQQFDFTRSLMPSSEKLLLCFFFNGNFVGNVPCLKHARLYCSVKSIARANSGFSASIPTDPLDLSTPITNSTLTKL